MKDTPPSTKDVDVYVPSAAWFQYGDLTANLKAGNYLAAAEDIWGGKEGKQIVLEMIAIWLGNAVGIQVDPYIPVSRVVPYPIIRYALWGGVGITVLDYGQVWWNQSMSLQPPKKT